MTPLIVICLLLAAAVLMLLIHLLRLKSAMREIASELERTRDMSYDRQLQISLFDNDLTKMASQMNRCLVLQKKLKLSSERSEAAIRQSVSDIAHDLRTPLTIISGNLQLLAPVITDKTCSERIRICSEKVKLLRNMTDDFFELSVLESCDVSAEIVRLDATNAFLSFIAESEAIISGAGLIPDIKFPEKSICINADPEMLSRMLGNLLNNIIKYAKESFTAEISEENTRCLIRFSNSIGRENIPDPMVLFERSCRADKSRKSGSAGLGLYIVKLLAEKQGADISAEIQNNRLIITLSFNTA